MGSPMGRLHLGGAPAETAVPNATSTTASATTREGRRATARAVHEHAAVANSALPGVTHVAEEVAFSGVTHVADDGTIKYFPANQLGDESWQVAHYDDGG